MARIYKESRYVLQLLIGKSYVAQYENVKISFYTKNPSNQVMADDDITIKGNVAEVMVDSTLFDNLEEGLIKYIVYGTKDGIPFIEERQSNYFLKTPLDFKPTTCILEDKSVTPSMEERNDDGYIIIEKSEGYDGLSRVVIDPQTIYNEGVEAGIAECSGPAPAPPQDGWGMTGYFNDWGGTPDIPFEEDGEWDGRPYKVIRNFEATGGEFKIRRNNAWTDSYTASFENIPQFAKLVKGDMNMYIDDGVWDIYLFFREDGEPNEMLILHPGTDLSTIQYEYTLTISTDKENAIIEIADAYRGFMADRYYGSVTVTMKYGCIYYINVYLEGYEDISDEITCYNDEERNYTLTKSEGGGCNLGNLVKEITENGNYVYYPSNDGLDGYKMADIRINVPGGDTGAVIQDYKWVRPSMADRAENGDIYIRPDEGYNAVGYIDLDPNDIYNEGVEAGRAEGGQGNSANLINPIVFSKEPGNTINAENVQIPTFVYEGNQYYNVDVLNMADKEEFKIQILFKPNNSGDAEPINIFGCEDSDWDGTTFGARIYQGQIYFRMSGEDVSYPYTENAWYDVEMGYNSSKRWVIVNGETLLETEHTSFNRPNQNFMIGAINSGGNAFRPFYGKIAATYIEPNGSQVWLLPKEDGTMDIYWNNRNTRWIQISGENNARFENDYISGDGMKSITWLGNLEDKWITPSMNDKNNDGFIVVYPNEGYSGLKRAVIDPQTLYNEGYGQGKTDGVNEQKSKLETINITENGTYRKEDGYNEIVVDVPGSSVQKVNVQKAGIKLSDSTFTEVPEWADFNGITDMKLMFSSCKNLQTIPLIDTSNATNMNFTFAECTNLQTIPLINTSSVTNMDNMFDSCSNLQTIPQLNTSNVTSMFAMFMYCNNLQTIPQIDTSNVTTMAYMFYMSSNQENHLTSLPKFNCQNVTQMGNYFTSIKDGMSSLTDVGGWENLKCNWNDKYGLATCPNLTHQSCINILNGLYDFVGNGSTETRTLRVHPNFLTTVGDEISIGRNKGWTITA